MAIWTRFRSNAMIIMNWKSWNPYVWTSDVSERLRWTCGKPFFNLSASKNCAERYRRSILGPDFQTKCFFFLWKASGPLLAEDLMPWDNMVFVPNMILWEFKMVTSVSWQSKMCNEQGVHFESLWHCMIFAADVASLQLNCFWKHLSSKFHLYVPPRMAP